MTQKKTFPCIHCSHPNNYCDKQQIYTLYHVTWPLWSNVLSLSWCSLCLNQPTIEIWTSQMMNVWSHHIWYWRSHRMNVFNIPIKEERKKEIWCPFQKVKSYILVYSKYKLQWLPFISAIKFTDVFTWHKLISMSSSLSYTENMIRFYKCCHFGTIISWLQHRTFTLKSHFRLNLFIFLSQIQWLLSSLMHPVRSSNSVMSETHHN